MEGTRGPGDPDDPRGTDHLVTMWRNAFLSACKLQGKEGGGRTGGLDKM